jgi:hypothetical protein
MLRLKPGTYWTQIRSIITWTNFLSLQAEKDPTNLPNMHHSTMTFIQKHKSLAQEHPVNCNTFQRDDATDEKGS